MNDSTNFTNFLMLLIAIVAIGFGVWFVMNQTNTQKDVNINLPKVSIPTPSSTTP